LGMFEAARNITKERLENKKSVKIISDTLL